MLQHETVDSDTNRVRRAFCWGCGFLMFVLGLALTQTLFSSAAMAQDPPPAPSNVQVELGGFMYIEEIGETEPDENGRKDLLEGGKILKVSWDEVTTGSPTGYRVQWREASASDWSAASHHDVVGASTTNYQIGSPTDGLTNGTTYDVRVFTRYGTDSLSDASTVVSATPLTKNQQLHHHIEQVVELAEATMPWFRKGWDNVPFAQDSSEYRAVFLGNAGAGTAVRWSWTGGDGFGISGPISLHFGVAIIPTEGGGTYAHEIHHHYWVGPAGTEPRNIPAGEGVFLSDAIGYLYLQELVNTQDGFQRCGPIFELMADLAASYFAETFVDHISDGGYWRGCGISPSTTHKSYFTMFPEILSGNVPEYFYDRFRGADGVWQRSELNDVWEWVLDLTFGVNGDGRGSGVGDGYMVLQAFNGFAGREYYNPVEIVQFAMSLELLRASSELTDEEKKTQIGTKVAAMLAEIPNPWQHNQPPTAPKNLTTDASVANQVTVTWEAPENQGHKDVHEYVVTLNNVAEESCIQQQQKTVTDLTSLTATFSGLPAGDYDISVIARNIVGADSKSEATATDVTVSGGSAELCVSVSAQSGNVAENGGTKTITVELSRVLTTGEMVEVPLLVSGVGAADFMLMLDPSSQAAVSLSISGADSYTQPRLVFGAGAQTATLSYVAVPNVDRRSPLVSVDFGTDQRVPSASGITGDLFWGGVVRFVVNNDDIGVVQVPYNWALRPSSKTSGDQFRLLFKTSNSRDATSTNITDYDRFIQTALIERGHEAVKPYIGNFKVLGSTENAHARQRLGLDVMGPPIFWLNGTQIAPSHSVFCQEQKNGGWTEDDFHTGKIKLETGGTESFIAAPFTGISNECRTRTDSGGLYLGSTGNVVVGAGGAETAAADAWDTGPIDERVLDSARERPFYGLSPVFEVVPTLNVAVSGSSTVTEGTSAVFTVTADNAPPASITVHYTVTQDGDFVATGSNTLRFSGTTATISVPTINDRLGELDGSVTVMLTPGSGYLIGSSDSASVAIMDDADPPLLSITAGPAVTEGSNAVFTMTATKPAIQDIRFSVRVLRGAFVRNNDAGVKDGAGWLRRGQTSATYRVPTHNDQTEEADGGVTVEVLADLISPVNMKYTVGTPNIATVTVNDNDGVNENVRLALSAPTGDVAEDSGSKDFTVTLGRALTGNETVTVPLSVTGVTVTDDFTWALAPSAQTGVSVLTAAPHSAQNPALRLASGASSATLRFTPVNNEVRTQRYVTVAYGTSSRAPSGVNVSIATPAGGPFSFGITDDEVGDIVVPFDWPLKPSTAAGGESFRLLFVTSGKRNALSADIADYDAFVRAHAAMGHASVVPYAGLFRVVGSTATVDADAHNDADLTDDGTGEEIFWLAGNKVADDYGDFWDSTWDDEANPRNEDGTAISPDAAGYWTGTNNSGTARSNNQLGVRGNVGTGKLNDSRGGQNPLSGGNASRATELSLYALSPVFTVGIDPSKVVTLEVNNSGAVTEGGTLTVTATLGSAAPTGGITIPVQMRTTGNPTASATDFNLSASSITVAEGATSDSVTFTAVDDTQPESAEWLVLELGTLPAGYTAGKPSSVTVTITDNDTAGVLITESGTPPNTTVAENSGTDTYMVVLTSPPTHDVTITVTSGTASAVVVDGSDGGTEGSASETLTFTSSGATAWNVAQTVTVIGVNDNIDNPNNRRTLDITHTAVSDDSNYQGVTIADVDVTVTDDDAAPSAITLSVDADAGTDGVQGSLAEGGGAKTVRVTATVDGVTRFSDHVNVSVAVGNGTDSATKGTDYEVVADLQILIPPGADSGHADFTFTPTDDSTDEGAETVSVTGTLLGGTVNPASLMVVDDDTAGVSVSGSVRTVGENNGMAMYTVVLDSQPTHDVTVTVTSGTASAVVVDGSDAGTEGSASETLTFTSSGATAWNVAQTVTVIGVNDSIDNPNNRRTSAVTHTSVSDDSNYQGVTIAGVTVTVTDDDAAPSAITLSVDADTGTDGVQGSLAEGGGAKTVRVTATITSATRFGVEQSVVVQVGASTDTAREGTDYSAVADQMITIAAGATSGHVDFTLTPTDDDLVEVNETISLAGSLAGVTFTNPASLMVVDDDTAGVSVSGSVRTVGENNGMAMYTVVLDSQPTHDVTVTVTSGTASAVVVDGSDPGTAGSASETLTFTSSGATAWNVAQTVTVIGVNDSIDNPNNRRTSAVTHTAVSDDSNYQGVTIAGVTVRVTDDDAAPSAITLSVDADTGTGGVQGSVAEGGGAKTVRVTATITSATRFGVEQSVVVQVGASTDTAREGTDYSAVADQTITIAAGATSGHVDFTLTPTDDTLDEPAQSLSITGTLAGVTFIGTTVGITDNDATPAIALSVSPTSVVEGDGATTVQVTATVQGTVRFDATRTVVVSVDGSGAAGVVGFAAVADFNITIAAGVVSGSAGFTLTPQDDRIDEANETITVSGTSAGPPAAAVNPATLPLTDDDTAGVTVSHDARAVEENNGMVTYTVVLDSQPTHNVTVTVTSGTSTAALVDGSDDGTVGSASETLMFTPSGVTAWDVAQTVTVIGVNDNIDNSGDSRTSSVTHTAASIDPKYQGATIAGVDVTVTDDDGAGVTISASTLSLSENSGAASYTVVLDSQPSADVTVLVMAAGPVLLDGQDSSTAFTAFETLTFTSSNWNTAQTIRLQGQNDSVNNTGGSRTGTLTHDFSSTDPNYGGLADRDVSVTVTDDDATPDIVLSVSPDTVAEDAGATSISVTATIVGSVRFDTAQTVRVTVSGPSGEGFVDFTPPNAFDITISAGAASGTGSFMLTPTNDDVKEADASLNVSGVLAGVTVTGASLALTDDEAVPTIVLLSPLNANISEGQDAVFRVSAIRASSLPLTVNLTVTETGGGDHVNSSDEGAKSVVLPAGDTQVLFTVSTTQDSVFEPDSVVGLALSAGTGYTTDGSSRSISVADNDAVTAVAVDLSVTNSGAVTEGGTLTVTATLATAATANVAVPLIVVDGTAAAADYSLSTSIAVASGQTSGEVTFTATDDSADEPSEMLSVQIGTLGAGYRVGTTSSVDITIGDNDATAVTLSRASGAAITEGTTLAYTVTLGRSLVLGESVSVPLSFSSGTGAATRGVDYTLACENPLPAGVGCVNLNSGNAALNFTGPSAMAVTVMLTAAPDNIAETGGETVDIGLGTPSAMSLGGGATGVDNAAVLTIEDPLATDVAVTLSVSDSGTVTEGSTLTVTATLASAATANAIIPVQAGGGTAAVDDYTLSASGVSISSGATTGTLTLTAIADDSVEGPETLTLEFGTLPTGYIAGTPNSVEITINDGTEEGVDPDPDLGTADNPMVYISYSGVGEIVEGGSAEFMINANPAPSQDITVRLGLLTSGDFGAAISGGDQVVIPAGQMSMPVTVTTLDDAIRDLDEGSFILVIADGQGYQRAHSVESPSAHQVMVADDEPDDQPLPGTEPRVCSNSSPGLVCAQLPQVAAWPGFVDFTLSDTSFDLPEGTARQITLTFSRQPEAFWADHCALRLWATGTHLSVPGAVIPVSDAEKYFYVGESLRSAFQEVPCDLNEQNQQTIMVTAPATDQHSYDINAQVVIELAQPQPTGGLGTTITYHPAGSAAYAMTSTPTKTIKVRVVNNDLRFDQLKVTPACPQPWAPYTTRSGRIQRAWDPCFKLSQGQQKTYAIELPQRPTLGQTYTVAPIITNTSLNTSDIIFTPAQITWTHDNWAANRIQTVSVCATRSHTYANFVIAHQTITGFTGTPSFEGSFSTGEYFKNRKHPTLIAAQINNNNPAGLEPCELADMVNAEPAGPPEIILRDSSGNVVEGDHTITLAPDGTDYYTVELSHPPQNTQTLQIRSGSTNTNPAVHPVGIAINKQPPTDYTTGSPYIPNPQTQAECEQNNHTKYAPNHTITFIADPIKQITRHYTTQYQWRPESRHPATGELLRQARCVPKGKYTGNRVPVGPTWNTPQKIWVTNWNHNNCQTSTPNTPCWTITTQTPAHNRNIHIYINR